MVVPGVLIGVVAKAGVEDRIHAQIHQLLHMAVHDLGRIAGRVRGNGKLAFFISTAGGQTGQHHLVAQGGEDPVPQGPQLIHAQSQGHADSSPAARSGPVAGRQLPLPDIDIGQLLRSLGHARTLLALVAGNKPLTAGEGVDGQMAVVGAAVADRCLGGVFKLFQILRRNEPAGFKAHGMQGRAVGAHEACDHRTDDLRPQLQLKGPQHRVIEEGAALHHHMAAQLLGGVGPDDLVDGVFHHADGQAGGDILHRGALLLGLLHGGVHKHRAAAAQIHRRPALQAPFGKLRYPIAHGTGKGFDKGAAAGGAGLVEQDRIDGPVFDAEALDVLAADVQNEIHVRLEIAGRRIVGNGLHHALVHAEGVLNQFFAVARAGGAADGHPMAAAVIDGLQLLAHQGHGVAFVGAVVAVQEFFIFGNQGQLGGGGAAVDAQPGPAGIGIQIPGFHRGSGMAGCEGLVVLPGGKERGQPLPRGFGGGTVLQGLAQGLTGIGFSALPPIDGRAHGDCIAAVFREYRRGLVQLQGLPEPLPQSLAVIQRAAQEHDLGLDFPPLGQTGDGLVDHGLIDAGRHIGLAGALVQKGLNVALGKDAAPGGDGVQPHMLQAGPVHFLHGHIQQHGHLVNERAGTAGTAAVHALVHAALEENNLGVLTAQLNHRAGVRRHAPHHFTGGIDLLDKGNSGRFRHAQAGRARDGRREASAPEQRLHPLHQLQGFGAHLGKVALIGLKKNRLSLQQHGFCRCGADVDSECQRFDGFH